jgi:alpha-galactosidase
MNNDQEGGTLMNGKKYIRLMGMAGAVVGAVTALWAAEVKVNLPKPDGKPADISKPVKVFILMGQSNMLGFGRVGPETQKGTLEYYCKVEKKYPFLLDEAGQWTKRSDVRYTFVMQKGDKMQLNNNDWLTVGKGKHIGPEIGFGYVVGEALREPVLLLKSCIGNRGIGWDLLPPGSERYEIPEKARDGREKTMIYAGYKDSPAKWEKGTEPVPIGWYAGKQYDDDVANAKAVLADLGTYYPGATTYEVAGFVWFQGHKDQGEPYASRYEQNLVQLIKALRKDFDAPHAKFVIATGCGNPGTEGGGKKVAEAQLAVSGETGKYPEFKGNVKTIDSRPFWPGEEESPSKAGYHYNHNAGVYMNVGLSLGQAMTELLKAQQ